MAYCKPVISLIYLEKFEGLPENLIFSLHQVSLKSGAFWQTYIVIVYSTPHILQKCGVFNFRLLVIAVSSCCSYTHAPFFNFFNSDKLVHSMVCICSHHLIVSAFVKMCYRLLTSIYVRRRSHIMSNSDKPETLSGMLACCSNV